VEVLLPVAVLAAAQVAFQLVVVLAVGLGLLLLEVVQAPLSKAKAQAQLRELEPALDPHVVPPLVLELAAAQFPVHSAASLVPPVLEVLDWGVVLGLE